jgi:hypothetical protein
MRGHMKRLGDFRHLREFAWTTPSHKLGDRIGAELVRKAISSTSRRRARGEASRAP